MLLVGLLTQSCCSVSNHRLKVSDAEPADRLDRTSENRKPARIGNVIRYGLEARDALPARAGRDLSDRCLRLSIERFARRTL